MDIHPKCAPALYLMIHIALFIYGMVISLKSDFGSRAHQAGELAHAWHCVDIVHVGGGSLGPANMVQLPSALCPIRVLAAACQHHLQQC